MSKATKTTAAQTAVALAVAATLSAYQDKISHALVECEGLQREAMEYSRLFYREYCLARHAGIPRADCEAPFKDGDNKWLINPLSDSGATFGASIGKYGSAVDIAMKNGIKFVSGKGDKVEVLSKDKLYKAVEEFRDGNRDPQKNKKGALGVGSKDGKQVISAESKGTPIPMTAGGVRIAHDGELATAAIDDVFKFLKSAKGTAARHAFATDILRLADMVRKEATAPAAPTAAPTASKAKGKTSAKVAQQAAA